MSLSKSRSKLGHVLVMWLLYFLENQHKCWHRALAFQSPSVCKLHPRSVPSIYFSPTDRIRGRALCTSLLAAGKTSDQTPRQDVSKRNRPTNGAERRKLNSDIFRLRKKQSSIHLAEQRLDEAITDMIKENEKDSGLNIPSLMQKRHEQTRKQKEEMKIEDKGLEQFPDIVSFHAVIGSHAKNAHKDRLAPRRAIGLLEKMKELSDTFPHLSPTIFTYNAVMEAYSNQITKNKYRRGSQNRSSEDEEIILRLYRELQEAGLSPNAYTKNMILSSIPNDSKEWCKLERWAFDYLDNNGKSIGADRNTYNTLFKVYSVVGNVKKAGEMLRKLLQWHQQQHLGKDTQTALKPSKIWFHCVLKALAVSKRDCDDHDDQIQRLLKEMKDLVNTGHADLQPDTTTFNHVLNVYATYGNLGPAINLMNKMEKASEQWERPDCVSYTTVIKTLASVQKKMLMTKTQGSVEIAEKATEIFESMRAKSILPNVLTYNTLINIWVNVGTRDALIKAEDLFSQIRYPDSVTYSTLIHGWSKTRLPEAGSKAQNLFKDVLRLPPSRQRRNFSITKLCNSVISAYAKSGNEDAPECVDSLLAQLEGKYLSGEKTARPDKITFLGIFDTYAKAGVSDAEERCDVLLERMSQYRDMLQLEDLEPDRVVYNAVLNGLAKSQQPDVIRKVEDILAMMESSTDERLRPDIVTYATVVDCYTKCGEMSLQRTDELLRFVERTFRSGDETLKPNAVFYSAILQAWAKTATVEGAEKAVNLLQRNVVLFTQGNDYAKPHSIVYNAVMDAIARSNMAGAGARAEELLTEMESLYQSGDDGMRPSRRSFNAVILAYRNEGNASKKAEEMLYRMEEIADSGRNEIRPDVVSYNNAIAAVVEDSDSENTADRAQALLDQMEVYGIKPDGRTYSPVIEAWLRRNDEKGHALADVMLTQFLDKVKESKKGNVRTKKESLYEDAVWNVINAYREGSDNDFYAQLASRGWISGG
uniref:Pentacotripeptide-repeat region of PRORP domain-containing protein n=1 Tax=Pseudo-nitzschia australis TaxID=44445 RepID=A0A7S4ERC5_9STRA